MMAPVRANAGCYTKTRPTEALGSDVLRGIGRGRASRAYSNGTYHVGCADECPRYSSGDCGPRADSTPVELPIQTQKDATLTCYSEDSTAVRRK